MALVLIADDDDDLRELLTATLLDDGHTVLAVADGQDAWHLCRQARPDLAVLDLALPGISGWDICRAIRADTELAAMPVIAFSAAVPLDTRPSADLPATVVLPKPISLHVVAGHVNHLTGPDMPDVTNG